jgi:hypothetical protein
MCHTSEIKLVYASGAGVRRCQLKEEKLIHVGYLKKKIHEVCRATLIHQVASTKVHERRRLETLSAMGAKYARIRRASGNLGIYLYY